MTCSKFIFRELCVLLSSLGYAPCVLFNCRLCCQGRVAIALHLNGFVLQWSTMPTEVTGKV